MIKQEIGVNAEREARIIAVQESRVFENIRNILIGVSQFTEVKTMNSKNCNKTMSILLGHINTPTKQFLNIGVADFNGDVFCSALPIPKNNNIADRDYFKRTVATRDFSFGNYQIGRATGVATINYGYPIMNEIGSVQFVVFIALDLNSLNKTVGDVKVPGSSTLTVTDGNNVVLVRYPENNSVIGTTWGENLINDVSNGEGSKEALDIGNVPRIFGFSRINSPNGLSYLHVIVGISISELMNQFPFNFTLWGILFFLMIVFTAVMGWLLGERIIRHLSSENTRIS